MPMERLKTILNIMSTPDRLTVREFCTLNKKGAIVFNGDLSDDIIIRSALNSCMKAKESININLDNLLSEIMYLNAKKESLSNEQMLDTALSGDCILILDNEPDCIVIASKKWDKRAVAEPPVETVQRGPREGFIEDLKTNLSLIQRKIASPALAIERFTMGKLSKTNVALVYVGTIAQPKFIKLIREKLNSINDNIDALMDSSYLVPLISPHPHSIFNQVGTTEKPDVVCAKLLEGRVALIVDGSPVVLTAPFLLIEDFQTAEDYYTQSTFSSFLRVLRFMAVLLSVFLPGGYVAMQIFHYNIIPVKFLVTLMNSVKGIPLTPLSEILFVLLLFEIIRESSVRMPRAVGMAMSIVGGLVLGETAVKSGMISSPAVMIVALSSIALYTAPNEVGILGIMRVAFAILGGLAGLYGLVLGVGFMLIMLVNFDSFGTPYLAPFAPLVFNDLKDSLLMSSTSFHKKRPKSIKNINQTRQK